MKVIRHQDVPACLPCVGGAPRFQEDFVSRGISENWFSILRADGEKDNNGGIVSFAHALMRRVFAPDLLHFRYNLTGTE